MLLLLLLLLLLPSSQGPAARASIALVPCQIPGKGGADAGQFSFANA
jgi:hypothetical protein